MADKKVFVEIMQIKADRSRETWGFMDLEYASDMNCKLYPDHLKYLPKNVEVSKNLCAILDLRDYEVKYVANVNDGWVAGHYGLEKAFRESDMAGLEKLFEQFNLDVDLYREYGHWKFTGHSLSVSDVVKVERIGSGEPKYYYCDSFGWKEIIAVNAPLPFKVGMGVTINYVTDRYPAHISRISDSGKTLWIKKADYKRTDSNGLSDMQDYEITPNPDAPEIMCKRHNDGSWYAKGGIKLTIGNARRYYDPHF